MGNNNKIQDSCQSLQTVVSVSAGLSGKAKEDFKKWYRDRLSVMTYSEILNINDLTVYSSLVIEWLDSVEIYIHSFPRFYKIIKYSGKSCYPEIEIESKKYFKNRTLANLSAIKKAVKIYNTEAEH